MVNKDQVAYDHILVREHVRLSHGQIITLNRDVSLALSMDILSYLINPLTVHHSNRFILISIIMSRSNIPTIN